MHLTFDPLWPWSALRTFLASASALVIGGAVLAGVAMFALPIVLHYRPGGVKPRQLLQGAGIGVVLLLAWLLIGGMGVSGGVAARLHGLAMSALFVLPFALAGLTVWTYLGVPGATRGRIVFILTVRMMALVLAFLAMLRPSLAMPEDESQRDLLYLVFDRSESMTIKDEIDNRSRWEQLLRNLRDAGPTLDRLRDEQRLEIVYHGFAGEVAPFAPDDPGQASGKQTDIGGMLRKLFDTREGTRPLRGLLLLSDGADNGTRFPALNEAARWRGLPCPIHTFSYGRTTTSDRQSDVIVTTITPDPSPAPVKSQLTVRATIDAPGFENREVNVRLYLDDKEVKSQKEVLRLTTGNEVKLQVNAPATPGEVKVTLRVEDPRREGKALPGELSDANNEIGTYLTVTREGVSVLLVDKARAYEPKYIAEALSNDARIRVFKVDLGGAALNKDMDPFQFDKQQYDVIILGDVSAQQVRAANPAALAAIERLVAERGAGFLMLGGYFTFNEPNGGWRGTEIEKVLPVVLDKSGQLDRPVKMAPTDAGLRLYNYILRLGDTRQETVQSWEKLHEMDGMVTMGTPKPLANVLATPADNPAVPMLVSLNYGQGRSLAFAGDTTWRWIRSPETKQMHSRFWRQMVLWLAKQEEAEGNVWVKPDVRRLPARTDLGFVVGLKSKGGVDLKGGTYQVEVIGPDGARTPVSVAPVGGEERGTFQKADIRGEYTIVVNGVGKDPEGNEVKGEARARFLVFDEDQETSRRAADHDFLAKLAAAGGGEAHRGEELTRFLERMQKPRDAAKQKLVLYPDWRSTARSPFLIGFFLAFVTLLATEWLARRRWGLA